MNNQKMQGNMQDNSLIVALALADEVKTARQKINPNAQSLLDNLGSTKVVFKWGGKLNNESWFSYSY